MKRKQRREDLNAAEADQLTTLRGSQLLRSSAVQLGPQPQHSVVQLDFNPQKR
jgi:hypothetical protein